MLALAHPAEGAGARQLALLLLDVPPQVEPGEEVGRLVLEAGVLLVGLRLLLGRALARVLEAQRGGDDDHLAHAAEALGLEDHPAQPRVDRQPGQPATELGEAGAVLLPPASAPVALRRPRAAAVGPRRHPAPAPPAPRAGRHRRGRCACRAARRTGSGRCRRAQRGHLEDDAGEVGAQDLGVGELGTPLEVLLAVEPDRDALGDAAAAAGALVGAGLADRLDGQPLHLGAQRVAGDARDAGVDDVPDAGDGQRGLGDVGGQHDAADRRGVRAEDAVLLGGGEPGVERARPRAGRTAGPRARRRCRGSPARRGGRRARRPAPPARAPGPRRGSPRSGRAAPARPRRRPRGARAAGGSGPRRGRCGRTPRRREP